MKSENKEHSSSLLFAFLVFAVAALLTLPFLHQLEFLRHTEADRALISWEMLKTKAWFAPTLFGDLYLTKPPLYYWSLASVFQLFGGISEGLARLPSAISSCILLATFFLFLNWNKFSIRESFLGTLALGSSAEFFRYGSTAEMDMFYSCLSGLALFFGFYANTLSRWLLPSLAAGTFLGLAFLAKGPPIIVFYGAGLIGLFLAQTFSERGKSFFKDLFQFFIRNILVLIIPLGLILLWVLAMRQSAVQTSDLLYQLQEELLRRFVDDSEGDERGKPWWYYFLHFPAGLLPWSLLLFPFVLQYENTRKLLRTSLSPKLLHYCLGVLGVSFLVFSLSSGKSTRYLLPIFPFAIVLLLPLLSKTFDSFSKKFFSKTSNAWNTGFLCLLTIILLARVTASYVIAPLAEAKRSSKPAVSFLQKELDGQALYVMEVFERWPLYYFIEQGGSVFRITPKLVEEWKNQEGVLNILLNTEEEAWRITLLQKTFPDAILSKKEFSIYKHHYLFIKIPAKTAFALQPQKTFPTAPTKAFEGLDRQAEPQSH